MALYNFQGYCPSCDYLGLFAEHKNGTLAICVFCGSMIRGKLKIKTSKELYARDFGIHFGERRRTWEEIFRIRRGREGKSGGAEGR